MLKPKRKTDENTVDAMAPSSEFIESRKCWTEIHTKHQELVEKRDGLELAVSLTRHPQDARRVSEALKKKAFPYRKLAQKRPHQVADIIDEARDEIEEMAPEYFAASERWHGAQRAETNRIAAHRRPANAMRSKEWRRRLKTCRSPRRPSANVAPSFAGSRRYRQVRICRISVLVWRLAVCLIGAAQLGGGPGRFAN